jgi:hypothetical protein
MTIFETFDIDGEIRQYQYSFEHIEYSDDVLFKVFSIPLDEIRWFSYRVKIINSTLAKSEQFSNFGNSEFAKKGIPEKIIQIASSELNRDIKSSPITFQDGNYLTPPSRKAWERLVLQCENAYLDTVKDCFIYKRILE